MRSQTHAAAGILFALALAKAGVFSVLGHGYLVFAFFGALLPDIDNQNGIDFITQLNNLENNCMEEIQKGF